MTSQKAKRRAAHDEERERVLKIIEDPRSTDEQRQEAIGLAINKFSLGFEAVIELANEAEHRKSHDRSPKVMRRSRKR